MLEIKNKKQTIVAPPNEANVLPSPGGRRPSVIESLAGAINNVVRGSVSAEPKTPQNGADSGRHSGDPTTPKSGADAGRRGSIKDAIVGVFFTTKVEEKVVLPYGRRPSLRGGELPGDVPTLKSIESQRESELMASLSPPESEDEGEESQSGRGKHFVMKVVPMEQDPSKPVKRRGSVHNQAIFVALADPALNAVPVEKHEMHDDHHGWKAH